MWALRDEMDWPGCLFEEKWRAGKQLREHHVEELRLLRELVEMDGLLNRKAREWSSRFAVWIKSFLSIKDRGR